MDKTTTCFFCSKQFYECSPGCPEYTPCCEARRIWDLNEESLGKEKISFMGWWDKEVEVADGITEPWEKFTIMIHGEEAGDFKYATEEDLKLAGYVKAKHCEKL